MKKSIAHIAHNTPNFRGVNPSGPAGGPCRRALPVAGAAGGWRCRRALPGAASGIAHIAHWPPGMRPPSAHAAALTEQSVSQLLTD